MRRFRLLFAFLAMSLTAPAAAAQSPELCDPGRPGVAQACPSSCRRACDDLNFLFDNAALCRPLVAMLTPPPDTPACVEKAAEAPASPASEAEIAEATDALVAETVADIEAAILAECGPRDRSEDGLAILIDAQGDGVTAPACVVGRRHITCRFGVISQQITDLIADFQPIVQADYMSVTAETLCDAPKERVVEHYRRSGLLAPAVARINEKFDEESTCLVETDEWLNNYQCSVSEGCTNLIDAVFRQFRSEIRPMMDARERMLGTLDQVRQQQRAIEEVAGLYDFFCS